MSKFKIIQKWKEEAEAKEEEKFAPVAPETKNDVDIKHFNAQMATVRDILKMNAEGKTLDAIYSKFMIAKSYIQTVLDIEEEGMAQYWRDGYKNQSLGRKV